MENLTAVPLILGIVRDELLIIMHDAIATELKNRAIMRGLPKRKRKVMKVKRKPKTAKA